MQNTTTNRPHLSAWTKTYYDKTGIKVYDVNVPTDDVLEYLLSLAHKLTSNLEVLRLSIEMLKEANSELSKRIEALGSPSSKKPAKNSKKKLELKNE